MAGRCLTGADMRFSEFKVNEVPDDGSRGGQEPNREPSGGLTAGPPYPPEDTEAVKALQGKLEELGYSVGATGVDGKYGQRTTRAVRAFKKDNNISGDGASMSAADLQKLSTAEKVENPTPTGNHSNAYSGGSDTLGDIEFAQGSGSGRVRMQNSGATRNKALDSRLMSVLEKAAEDAGVDVVVFSGGQDQKGRGTRRTGSIRHDNGLAADIWIYSDGRRLPTSRENPIVAKFIAACVANGAKGIGAGPGYMGGVGIHVDLWGERAGARTWGAGGRSANTPTYVAQAYQAGQTGSVA